MNQKIKTSLVLGAALLLIAGASTTAVKAAEVSRNTTNHQTNIKKNRFRLEFERFVSVAYSAAEEMAEGNFGPYAGLKEEIQKAKNEMTSSPTVIEAASSVIRFAQKFDSNISTADDFVNSVTNDYIVFRSAK